MLFEVFCNLCMKTFGWEGRERLPRRFRWRKHPYSPPAPAIMLGRPPSPRSTP
jgi:hypothetical protein